MSIVSLFSLPIYQENDASITSEKDGKTLSRICSEGMRPSDASVQNCSTISINSYVLEDDNLRSTKDKILNHLNKYVETIICPKTNINLYITQSWILSTKPGQNHHEHYHPNSLLSGVCYPKAVENDKIHFDIVQQRLFPLFFFDASEWNIWNSTIQWIHVKTNDIIIFPSWIKHYGELNPDQTTNRIAIAFNTFIEGNIGKEDELNQLKIKSIKQK